MYSEMIINIADQFNLRIILIALTQLFSWDYLNLFRCGNLLLVLLAANTTSIPLLQVLGFRN